MENYMLASSESRSSTISGGVINEEKKKPASNEVRITTTGSINGYVSYGLARLKEEQFPFISFTGKGNAVGKAVSVAEIVKRKSPGLHQLNELTEEETVDLWKSKEGKLDHMEVIRFLPVIKITLSKTAIDPSTPGYQIPLTKEETKKSFGQEKLEIDKKSSTSSSSSSSSSATGIPAPKTVHLPTSSSVVNPTAEEKKKESGKEGKRESDNLKQKQPQQQPQLQEKVPSESSSSSSSSSTSSSSPSSTTTTTTTKQKQPQSQSTQQQLAKKAKTEPQKTFGSK